MSLLSNDNTCSKPTVDKQMHPFEIQLLALETHMAASSAEWKNAKPELATSPDYVVQQIRVLRKDVEKLRGYHGCVSAVLGDVCEHCLAVVQVRLRMILEADRRAKMQHRR